MKIKRVTEIINTKKFSDMENWSTKEPKIYVGTKELDLKLGNN